MRDRLKPQSIPERVEEPPLAAEELEFPGDRAHLPSELFLGRRRGPVVRARAGLKEHPVSLRGDPHGDQDVVEDRIVRNGLEEVPTDRVDGARGAHRRVHAGLVPANELLVAPVEAEPLPDRRRLGVVGHDQLATHRAHVRVGKGSDERAKRPRLESLPRVSEHHDLTPRLRHEIVQHGGFAPARRTRDDHDADRLVLARPVDGAVGGAIGPDDNLELPPRVVERQKVVQSRRDPGGFVVRHDQHRDGRLRTPPTGWP